MSRPLFVSGTARGGTNLTVMMASAHPDVSLVQDPYLALFKSFRNATVTGSGVNGLDLKSPLDEYYYFEERLAVMRQIQAGDLNVAFDPARRIDLATELAARMKLSAPLLIPYLDQLRGRTYREMFESGLEIIGLARETPSAKWLGFNDNWTVEFFAPLGRSFRDARFIIIIRDVRSAVASHLRMLQATHKNPLFMYPKDASMIAMTLSFVRCWRKQIAFARHFQGSTEFKGRLHLIRYEDIVCDPVQQARALCAFLEVDYLPEMVDTNNFIAGDGRRWISNSSQENVPETGIYTTTVDRWKETLSSDLVELIEFVAGPDLELAGYTLSEPGAGEGFPWGAYERHAEEHRQWKGGGFGWRTDNRNPEVDFGLELLRRNCLRRPTENEALIERCFLFPEVYQSLMDRQPLFGTRRG